MAFTSDQLVSIQSICEKYQVAELHVFGSFVDETSFNEKSDIDFLVRFQHLPIQGSFDRYMDMLYALEGLLNREVDLVSSDAIRNPFFRVEVESTRQEVYSLNAA